MARVAGYSAQIYEISSTKKAKLGTLLEFPDGRRFRYCLNGAVNLAAGRLVQMTVPVANHTNIAVQAAAAVGAFTVNVTLGATAVVANEYADGYLHVNDAGADTTTEGYLYRIKSHPANAGSGTLAITLYEDSPVKIALTTNSEVTLLHSPYYGVLIHPSPPTSTVVGVTPTAVTASYYFWLQTAGPAAVLTDGTIVAGRTVMPSTNTDGAVMAYGLTEATPNTEILAACGKVMTVNATTEESLISLFGLD